TQTDSHDRNPPERLQNDSQQAVLTPSERDSKHILKGRTTYSTVKFANMREADFFHIAELCQFNSYGSIVDIEIDFEDHGTPINIEGISFEPLEKVEDQAKKDKVELQVMEDQDIVEVASPSLVYTSFEELKQILRIGIHLKDYKMWFSLDKKGEHSSMKDCLIPNEDFTPRYESHSLSRFHVGFYHTEQKINGETRTSTVHLVNPSGDVLHMAELYHVTSSGSLVDLEIDFENPGINIEGVEGILFQPLEKWFAVDKNGKKCQMSLV
nr:hypothetical protein [Tanacetum cinerariifolium]